MGVRNYLIEGVSGAGKTAVATELQRRGYQAIHGDRELAYWGDPTTGRPMAPETEPPTALWVSKHHIWDVEKEKWALKPMNCPGEWLGSFGAFDGDLFLIGLRVSIYPYR